MVHRADKGGSRFPRIAKGNQVFQALVADEGKTTGQYEPGRSRISSACTQQAGRRATAGNAIRDKGGGACKNGFLVGPAGDIDLRYDALQQRKQVLPLRYTMIGDIAF